MATLRARNLKPVRIKNPVSQDHTVYLKANQTFEVFLSNGVNAIYDSADVKYESTFIEIADVKVTDEGRIYTFKQKGNLDHWGSVSTTYLGEVTISGSGSSKTKFESRLCIYLRATNPYKTNIITVINPKGHTLKLAPCQLLEVVAYNPLYGMPLYWEADTSVDPMMEVVAYSYIQPNTYDPASSVRKINDAFFTYPRLTVESSRPYYEYHFWMRCNPSIAKHIESMQAGMYPNGKVRLVGYVGTQQKASLDLNIVFNWRKRSDATTDRIRVVDYYDSDMTKSVILPNTKKQSTDLVPYNNGTSTNLSRTHASPPYSSGTTKDWSSYNRSGYEGLWGKESTTKIYRKWCSHQEFKVIEKKEPLFGGCKVLYLDDFDLPVGSCSLVNYYAEGM